MLFNSYTFAVFFAVVLAVYPFFKHRTQNTMLLAASYIFYGWWDWRFLSLILMTTGIDYFCAIKIDNIPDGRRRRRWLLVSVVTNLALLGFFKYFNFFTDSFARLMELFGWRVDLWTLKIVLPVGISFYTFQSMSYVIDVYRRDLKPVRHFFDFALFISFFPQLVAGPIERARHLLPQVLAPRKRTARQFLDGCHLIAWGLFQKVFIADNLSRLVTPVFSAPGPYEGARVLLALYAFAFQIYCDFAGYSDIARGTAKCLGFELMVNFNLPYFSADPREFWRRWHISLSTWLKDYLYIPLGGSRLKGAATTRNLLLTMTIGGLWHGAKWTFVVWGLYHGLLLAGHRLFHGAVQGAARIGQAAAGSIRWALSVVLMFHLVCLGWLFFRAQSLTQVLQMLESMTAGIHPGPQVWHDLGYLVFFISFLLGVQAYQYRMNDESAVLKWPLLGKMYFWLAVFFLVLAAPLVTGIVDTAEAVPFIYFQF